MNFQLKTLIARWLFTLAIVVCACGGGSLDGGAATADETGAGPALMSLLASGRVPPQRQAQVVELICQRGGPDDLAYVFDRALSDDGFAPDTRLAVLTWLADTSATRKIQPTGDLRRLGALIAPESKSSAALRGAAIRLAAAWRLESVATDLESLAGSANAGDDVKRAALEGLVALGGSESRATIERLTGDGQSIAMRAAAASALARLDLTSAAKAAAALMAAASTNDDLTGMVDAFLTRKGGPDALAQALAGAALQPDVAKLALRHMYSVGRSDAALSDTLSAAAGITTDNQPPSVDEVAEIVRQVNERGDAARGESVFRRADLNCLKCHAVAGGGGNVGPELTAVGSISPPDYVANSILNPNMAIKEQFLTRVIATVDGLVYTGIVADRNDRAVTLRDAAGALIRIPTADIDEELEGPSLMPQGLTKFLTRDELVDLVRFISELGKPGPYAVDTSPVAHRWRVLRDPPKELVAGVPSVAVFREMALNAPPEAWSPFYSLVSGDVPLAELSRDGMPTVVYLQSEFVVSPGGEIGFRVESTEPTFAWINAEPFGDARQFVTALIKAGRAKRSIDTAKVAGAQVTPHRLTLRVEISPRSDAKLRAELFKPADSSGNFQIVGGP